MREELFDLLDKHGHKTGETKPRRLVHRDGDWHRSAHIWIINNRGEILLQRRSATKESHPNMLDISCAGHLAAGEDSLTGAMRELKEELNLDVEAGELIFIKTLKVNSADTDAYKNNEFDDVYLLRTDKSIEDMTPRSEEISEILYVPYATFKEMVKEGRPDLLRHEEEFDVLFNYLEAPMQELVKRKLLETFADPFDKPTDIIGFSETGKAIAKTICPLIGRKEICFFDEKIKRDPTFHYIDFEDLLAKTEIMIFTVELPEKYHKYLSRLNQKVAIFIPATLTKTIDTLKQFGYRDNLVRL